MQHPLRRLDVDGFVISIHAALIAALVVPAPQSLMPALTAATAVAIALLFFIHGARIEPADAYRSLFNWRLHVTTLLFTFVAFPVLGLALKAAPSVVLDPRLYPGVLFLCLVPSTVQASVTFTSIAGGSVPTAIVCASLSNLVGVFLTPALALALMTTSGQTPVHRSAVITIVVGIVLPFALGQVARRRMAGWVALHPRATRSVGRASIVMVIYAVFSVGEREDVWRWVTLTGYLQLIVVSTVLVCVMLVLTRKVASRMGFAEGDIIAAQFCGTKKAMVTGLPMAAVLFSGQVIELMVLPLMVFHQVQLVVCASVARRYARLRREGRSPVPIGTRARRYRCR